MTLHATEIATAALPGQFVMVKTSPSYDPFLKRPISIHRIDRTAGLISLVYQVVGRGTQLMAQRREQEEIELIGPLGNGFRIPDEKKCIAIVGGGAGIAPLFALAAELVRQKKEVYVMLGAQNREKLIAVDDFESLGCKVLLATDDGSRGRKGFVTQLLEELSKTVHPDVIYACGPLPMLKGAVRIAENARIPCQVSLEERMGCGTGACIGCVTKVRGEDGSIVHKRVCHDGPVFLGSEVVFA